MSTATFQIKPDYLNSVEELKPFHHYPLRNLDFSQIIQDKKASPIERQILVDVLRDQYSGLEANTLVKSNIDSLIKENTFSVTTGHQLVLFGGPLFTVYKIMSTIRLTEKLKKEHPQYHFVPVFWIHTEDHDFEEINHYFLDFGEKRTYPGQFQTKVGAHLLEERILDFAPKNFSQDLIQPYQPGQTLAHATRLFFHTLFQEYGLVILDADDARLKQVFAKVMLQEVASQPTQAAVNDTSRALELAGYTTQIHARDINLFYLDEVGRDRIIPQNGHFRVKDRDLQFSLEDIRQLIEEQPEKLSPNVSLRPLYQEMILPNLAYFGGWGELSYWLQLKGIFDHFGINFPAVLPRFSATVIPPGWRQKWRELGFEPKQVLRPLPDLYRAYMPKLWDSSQFDLLEQQILQKIEEMRQYIQADISQTLAHSADALGTKSQRYLRNLRKKTHRIIRHQQRGPFEQIEALKLQVNPDGQVQERVWSLATIAQWTDPNSFLKQVYQSCDPLNFEHQLLEL